MRIVTGVALALWASTAFAGAEAPVKRYLYLTSPDAAQKAGDFSARAVANGKTFLA